MVRAASAQQTSLVQTSMYMTLTSKFSRLAFMAKLKINLARSALSPEASEKASPAVVVAAADAEKMRQKFQIFFRPVLNCSNFQLVR